MDYKVMAETFSRMEATTKRLELTNILAGLFKVTPSHLIDKVAYLIQGKLYPDYMGVEIGMANKLVMKVLAQYSNFPSQQLEKIYQETGDIGITGEKALTKRSQITLFMEPLTVERIYSTLDQIAHVSGSGSAELRLNLLVGILNDASPIEARYILRTITGKLRLGIADYTILDALSLAYTDKKDYRPILERAYNISSDLGAVARNMASHGLKGIRNYHVQVGKPIRPMLAERLSTAEEILARLEGKCAVEYKLDGERLQIHRNGSLVELFTRRLEKVTEQYPDVVKTVFDSVIPTKAILEGEVVAINPDTGDYLPFQELMHRRRKHGIKEIVKQYPVTLNYFDILLNESDCTNKPYSERRVLLEGSLRQSRTSSRWRVVPQKIVDKNHEIEDFMTEAIAAGCEGLMAKSLRSPYRAGAREFSWIKLKREYQGHLADSVDLVVVGGFHGQGRRAGTYGTYLLAAYNKETDHFMTTCKIGTGFTDKDLAIFKAELDPLRLTSPPTNLDVKMQADIWFTPQIVIEVIASEITLSPIHTACLNVVREGAGLSLRFPKFTGKIRADKAPSDSTSTKELLEMFNRQIKKHTSTLPSGSGS